jgi:hypothetical protein
MSVVASYQALVAAGRIQRQDDQEAAAGRL